MSPSDEFLARHHRMHGHPRIDWALVALIAGLALVTVCVALFVWGR